MRSTRSLLYRKSIHGFLVKTKPREMELRDAYIVMAKQVKEMRVLLQVSLCLSDDQRQDIKDEIIRIDGWIRDKNKELIMVLEIKEEQ